MHPERRTYLVPAPATITVQSYWKHWPCLFPQHGPGRKHERVLGMAEWQWAIVEQHPAAFLRGLFHSDGCRVRNWATRMVAGRKKRYDYPRWQFTNSSGEIRGWSAMRATCSASRGGRATGRRSRCRGGRRWPSSTG